MNRLTAITLAGGLALLLSACGGGEAAENTDDVASLATTGAPASPAASATSPASAERPLVRPDASEEEEDRLYDIYWTCLTDHGVPGYSKAADGSVESAPKPGPVGAGRGGEDDPAALAACAHLEPEAPWQRAQRIDPHYADKLRDWITCVRSHGIDAFESEGFLSFESLPSEDKMKLVDECEMKAFDVA
ncbi:hypothetical protein ACIA8K_27735 [Catenuloplanes sp. NPDC051500]|uniref:hypothetical protein n=1 Tax=Catenuloplanes sp. NPDC051500 TaxID=3363959 RepID=UPI0037B8AA0C